VFAANRYFLDRFIFGYTYHSDGLATVHYSPFVDDKAFERAYGEILPWWHERILDVRWRMYILTRCAMQCATIPGAFTEFGVFRGGCSYMILRLAKLPETTPYYLFDTFSGIPDIGLTRREQASGLGGALQGTSSAEVAKRLGAWEAQIRVVEGDVFETLDRTETGPIAFCHMDLNASAPTVRALDYVYSRLTPGAMIVFDDYTQLAYKDQRTAIDRFFAEKAEIVVPLPTGQGFVVKL